ncbi:MAG TPA: VIT1/CCC1 transporter family protein [Candidatus Limnocylindrales bacterium]|nr:VIT1/CCC1 transporter family protein [Candidatus Limnocylindrales bacterium]
MSLDAIQQKKQVIESRSRIREFVFGIQDGLISTVGLLAGIQSATENNLVVIVTGLTAMFSGAISMATGSFLSSGAQKDIFDKELADAERLADREPYIAAEGLLKALGDEGLSKEQSYRMVKVLLLERNVFLRTFQEKVFGLGSAEINQPIKAALVMGLSFIVGAIIPILPYLAMAGVTALYLSVFLSASTLFIVGAFKGHLAGQSLAISGGKFFIIAVSAAGLGYLIGLTVQFFFPGISIPV